jgi:GH24 family phage-related lysozyme (muramidase)
MNSDSLAGGSSYTDSNQLPAELWLVEGNVLRLYADPVGIPTIGIGINLTVDQNMALVLNQISVNGVDLFSAAAGKGYSVSDVVQAFETILNGYSLGSSNSTRVGLSAGEEELQDLLDTKAASYFGLTLDQFRFGSGNQTPASATFSYFNQRAVSNVLAALLKDQQETLGGGQFDYGPYVINPYGSQLTQWLENNTSSLVGAQYGIPAANVPATNTGQWEALMSLFYNQNPNKSPLIGRGLMHALQEGNVAQAWYQIRYVHATSQDTRRRYYESQMFGLSQPGDTIGDALEAYEMLDEHRTEIVSYEQAYGTDPDGSNATRAENQIRAANAEVQWFEGNPENPRLGAPLYPVQTLAQAFNAEADLIIDELNSTYGSILPQIVNGSEGAGGLSEFAVSSTNIFVAPSEADIQDGFASQAQLTVDAGAPDPGPYGAQEAGANHIVLGTGAGDFLEGGLGNDLLVAGSGDETLQAGAGSDTLIGGSGNDVLGGGAGKDVFDCLLSSGATNFIVDQSGNGSIYINQALFVPAGALSPTVSYQWTDGTNTYKFTPGNEIPASDLPTFQAGLQVSQLSELSPWIGELTITGPGVNGGTLKIVGFDLGQAEESSNGFLGIKIPYELNVTAGATIGTDPPATFPAGSEQSYTFSVAVPASQAQTVTFTLSGASPSDFEVQVGQTLETLNSDHTFTVTLPAGATSVSFGLIDVTQNDGSSDIASGAKLTFINSLENAPDLSGSPIEASVRNIAHGSEHPDSSAGPLRGDVTAGKRGSATDMSADKGSRGSEFPGHGGGRTARGIRRCGRVVIPAVVLFALAACSGASWSSDSSEIQPGQQDYPVTNPRPVHFVKIDAKASSALAVTISAVYESSANAGGTMESGHPCVRTVGMAATAPFNVIKRLRLVPKNGIYTATAAIDGFLPGRCAWHFTGLDYSVSAAEAPSKNSYVYTLPYDILALYRDGGPSAVQVSIWCMRDPRRQKGSSNIRFNMCDDPETMIGEYRAKMSPTFLTSVPSSERERTLPLIIGRNTTSIRIDFRNVDRVVN